MPALCITNTPTKARQKVVLVSPHFEPGAVHLWSRFGQEAPRRREPAGGVPQRGGGGGHPVHSPASTAHTAPSTQHQVGQGRPWSSTAVRGLWGSPCPPAWSRYGQMASTPSHIHPSRPARRLVGQPTGGHPRARAAKASEVTLSALRSRGRPRGRKPLSNTTNPFNYSPLSKLINGGGFQQI